MISHGRDLRIIVWSATLCSFAMIANQIAGKAVRDALFLTHFPIETLPRMVVISSVLSLLGVLLASRILRSHGPRRLVPGSFAFSSLLLLAIALVNGASPQVGAVCLYLQVAVFGAILVSWFWSLLSECFDPRTAREQVGQIASGGTLGGLAGGLLAERVGALFSAGTMLPILAGLHLLCALLAIGVVSRQRESHSQAHEDSNHSGSGFQILRRSPYLQNLAVIVFLGTLSAALLDFAFKMHATETHTDSRTLLRFFASFYTIASLATFVVQAAVVPKLLKTPRDLTRNVIGLPAVVALGSLVSLLLPSLLVLALARGFEAVMRNSFFRSSYEVFFNPLNPNDKRATKTIIDVGFDRLGDFVGGLVIQAAVFLVGVSAGVPYLLMLAVILGGITIWRMSTLHRGYVGALKKTLKQRLPAFKTLEDEKRATQTAFMSQLTSLEPSLARYAALGASETSFNLETSENLTPSAGPETQILQPKEDATSTLQSELESGQPKRVIQALESSDSLDHDLVPIALRLLAWNPVSAAVTKALQGVVEDHEEGLIQALLNPETDFAIRRRLPAVLAAGSTQNIVDALLKVFDDKRFEVRYRSALALAKIHNRYPKLKIDKAIVLETITRESEVDQRMWRKRQLLDDIEASEKTIFYREALNNRTERSLEHVFHLLSLTYPKKYLRIAYDGLHTDEPTMRATALEYLESILPTSVRESLWPMLAGPTATKPSTKTEEELMESLLVSHESILLRIEQLKPRSQ